MLKAVSQAPVSECTISPAFYKDFSLHAKPYTYYDIEITSTTGTL